MIAFPWKGKSKELSEWGVLGFGVIADAAWRIASCISNGLYKSIAQGIHVADQIHLALS
jgi:hypothetical protein